MKSLHIKSLIAAMLVCLSVSTSQAQTEPRLVLPIGHTESINSAVFSPDGKYALTASGDHTSRLYDVASGKEIHILNGSNRSVKSAMFSPDGKTVLTSDDDNLSHLYQVETGVKIRTFDGRNSIFNPNGKEILTVFSDSLVRTYSSQNGEELITVPIETNISSITISPCGRFLLVSTKNNFSYVYDANTGKKIKKIEGARAIYSPDGNLILTSNNDSLGLIYDVATLKIINVIKCSKLNFNGFVFSPDSKSVLCSSWDGSAFIFDVSSRKELKILTDIETPNFSTAFSPDSRFVILGNYDKNARVFDAITGIETQLLSGHTDAISSVVFSPNGKLALTCSWDKSARIFDVNSGRILHKLEGSANEMEVKSFSSDGKYCLAVCQDKTVKLYDFFSGNVVQTFSGHTNFINSAVFSPDGQSVITGSIDSTTRIYSVFSGKEMVRLNGSSILTSAVVNQSGVLALIAGYDSLSWLYNTETGERIRSFRGVHKAVFIMDDNFALVDGADSTSFLYSILTGKKVKTFNGRTAEFFNNGEFISTNNYQGEIQVYKTSTFDEIMTLQGLFPIYISDGKIATCNSIDGTIIYDLYTGNTQELDVAIALCSPDGKYALTFDEYIYEFATGSKIKINLQSQSSDLSIIFSPDGNYISIGGVETTTWQLATGRKLYTRLQLKDNDWLVYDEYYRFDGTPGAIEKLYFTCGLEVIDLAQMKDSLWVPGLVEKIMSGQEILINDKPAPKLSDLNICDLTPVIEPIDQENKKILKYRITPRNGGLGNTEVYINGNLTYSLKPQQLHKVKENKKEVYYLTLSTDTLQQYLIGKKNDENPIVVKSKVKGSGIYGRGVELEIAKTNDDEKPQFYGVFIGVNEYGNPQKTASDTRYRNLDYAAKDANDLSLAVEKTAANLFQSDSHIYRLTGTGTEAPTKENLQRVLAEIGEKSKASDILYIFFAGHGDIKKGKNEEGQEQDQIRFMLMNADKANPFTTSFGVEELTKWCSPQKIKAQKRVFVFDACHSGKIIDQTMAFNGRGDDEGARIRQLDKLKDKNGMMILAAAADDESAYEDETLNQGVLTYHLLQVMKEQSDTSLVVRNWFDETIDLVKDYSKANGNKQEPSSFGDGRFEIGNVNQDVREAIKITCPKTRLGACVFTANAATKQLFPNVQKRVNEYFSSNGRGDNLVFSKNAEKAYHAQGLYMFVNGKVQISYDLYFGKDLIAESIELPVFISSNEDILVEEIIQSIKIKLIELENRKESCKFSN